MWPTCKGERANLQRRARKKNESVYLRVDACVATEGLAHLKKVTGPSGFRECASMRFYRGVRVPMWSGHKHHAHRYHSE